MSQQATPGSHGSADSRLLSNESYSAVSAIVDSVECRKALLELSSALDLENNNKLQKALQADEEHLISLLVSVFNSKSAEREVLGLQGHSAQCFLDVVQDALDYGSLSTPDAIKKARRIIHKLSAACGLLPTTLYITGVTEREAHPTFGGGYGDIYRASYENKPVALKYMRHFLRGSSAHRHQLRFLREALVWRDLRHPFILPFLGIDNETFPLSICIVSPWMEHGTVIRYLKGRGRDHDTVNRLLHEIAQGLEYLHRSNIVHGDLRGANILIGPDHGARLADFGLSVFTNVSSSMRTSNRGGCVYWMAPELIDPDRFGLSGKFVRTTASDVYAFGCVCFELYTGRAPFADLPEPTALLKILEGKRAKRPRRSNDSGILFSDDLWEFVMSYWEEKAALRPTIQDVVQDMVWPTADHLHAGVPEQPLYNATSSTSALHGGTPSPSATDSDAQSFFAFPPNDPELELNADVLRALQDCRAGLSNAARLTKALQLESQHVPRALNALRDKCISWQERISMQIPWAANLARQSMRGITQGLHLHLVATNDRLLAALRLFDEVGPTDWQPGRYSTEGADSTSILTLVEPQYPAATTLTSSKAKPLFGNFSASLSLSSLLPKKRRRGQSTTSTASEQSTSSPTQFEPDQPSTFSVKQKKSQSSLRSKKFDPTASFLTLNY
ncbi:Kinase-like protein [Mycena chlorophos]|uniref:Kinase-like protein n=1 Tax=Mycena chlorophos TaxID=658473 RepID=A0A8H6TKU0_MYCCL|nr:Kinase-like protein [Mycena chlorophos]